MRKESEEIDKIVEESNWILRDGWIRRRLTSSRIRANFVYSIWKYKISDHYFYPRVPPLAKNRGGMIM
jgi:hypothetical protein